MDKEAIRKELKKVRDEIRSVKSEFLEKKDKKEGHFEKGEDYSNEIDLLYDEVKKIEKDNDLDGINEELEKRKKEFENFSILLKEADVKLKEAKSKSFQSNRNKPVIKTISLERTKKEISSLGLKLQTQVLSLDKESEISKKISELKESIENISGNKNNSSKESSEFRQVKREHNSIRKKYHNAERRIRSLYKKIRLISKEKKQIYKKIDELRALKKKMFENFRSQKKEYSNIGKTLRDLFKKENDFLSDLGESPIQRKKKFDKNLKVKQKEIEDKLMKKGVITTEDLLMFQSGKKF